MEIINRVYFDNKVIRELIENSEIRKGFFTDIALLLGPNYQPLKSYYLFFEYIGFHKNKLEIPKVLHEPNLPALQDLSKKNLLDSALIKIDNDLKESHDKIKEYIVNKLYALESHIKHRIKVREVFVKKAKELYFTQLHINLFGDLIDLFRKDLREFVETAAEYLAWDLFCTLIPKSVSIPRLRQRQLAYWFNMHQNGITLPFGKLIDDHAKYYDIKFNSKSNYKSYEDMVDAEALTYLVTGLKATDQTIVAINYITFDDSTQIGERIQLGLGTLQNIEKTLNVCTSKQGGKAYMIDKATGKIVNIQKSMTDPLFIKE